MCDWPSTEMEQLPLLPGLRRSHAAPFLRWAGSKRRLAPTILSYAPRQFGEYIEPFVGGGSVFFALRPPVALLSDANHELINAYRAVRDHVEPVISRIRELAALDSPEFYLEYRKILPETLDDLERASRFIYLNRTCYNGLFRTNRNGQFNVPRGMKKPSAILQEEKLLAASSALQGALLEAATFEFALSHAKAGDFVYLDPPYVPPDPAAKAFTEYTKSGFGMDDQIRLANWFERLTEKGVFALTSNSRAPDVERMYPSNRYTHVVLSTRRNVAAKTSSRAAIEELLIANYPLPVGGRLGTYASRTER
jgi:DNA adenine methylase